MLQPQLTILGGIICQAILFGVYLATVVLCLFSFNYGKLNRTDGILLVVTITMASLSTLDFSLNILRIINILSASIRVPEVSTEVWIMMQQTAITGAFWDNFIRVIVIFLEKLFKRAYHSKTFCICLHTVLADAVLVGY